MNNKGLGTVALIIATAIGTGLLTYGLLGKLNKITPDIETIATPVQTTNSVTDTKNIATKKVERIDLTGEAEKRVVRLYGVVGSNSDSIAKEITRLSNQSQSPIYLLINSPGGSVLDGAMVVSAIEASKAPIYTVCEQLCASMAFIIHQYGTKRLMVDRAILMAHPASGGVQGTLEEMNSQLQMILKYVYKMNDTIATRAELTPDQFKQLWVSQLWMDAEDSTAAKFNDSIVNLNINPSLNILDLLQERQRNQIKEKFNVKW